MNPQYPMVNPIQQAVMNGVQSYFNRGTRGPSEYGMPQNSWTPPTVAPQHYPQHQQPPYAGMGFNPNQSTGQHQYGTPQHEQVDGTHREQIKQYMRDICSGTEQMPPELMQMVCYAAAQAVQEYMGNEGGGSQQRYSAGGYSEESHEKFRETIEKIRKTPHMQEKMRLISECFPSVQQGTPEHRVLVDLVTKVPSIEQRANNLQMKPEQYRSAKSKLKQMLK